MTFRLFLIFLFSGCTIVQAQATEGEKKLHQEINTVFQENYKFCVFQTKNAVTNSLGKTEFWKVCVLKNGNRIIQIESHSDEIFNQEIYFEKNGQLRYAKETENYMPLNSFSQVPWNCKFYFENGELATFISLGHGKTENDTWEPESILEMYKNRLAALKNISQQ